MTEKSFVQRQAVLLYFGLVFLISWLGTYLIVDALQGGVSEPSDLLIIGFPVILTPFGAGILMSYLADGRKGLSDLFSRMRKWKVGIRWYLPLAIFPILLLSVLSVLSVVVSPEMVPSFVVPFIFIGLAAGFFEETGWTGFAFPRMSLRKSMLGAALLLGTVHAVWHIFPDYLSNFGAMGGYYWGLYTAGFLTHVVALRVLIVWVYANTDSLLLATLMHGSSSGFYGLFAFNLVDPELRAILFIVYGTVLWLPAIAVSLKYGKTLKA